MDCIVEKDGVRKWKLIDVKVKRGHIIPLGLLYIFCLAGNKYQVHADQVVYDFMVGIFGFLIVRAVYILCLFHPIDDPFHHSGGILHYGGK